MATRRAWQPATRQEAEGGDTELEEGGTRASAGEDSARPPPLATPTSAERDGREDDAMPPDPWAAWYRANPESSTFVQHYGGPRHSTSSTGWDDAGWNAYMDRGAQRTPASGWDDSGWNRSNRAGWLSDGEMRGFNVALPQNTTAMNNGRWAGSYDDNYVAYHDGGWTSSDGRRSDLVRTNEKVSVPEFSGEGSEQDVGKSARSYVRKVQVWLRCTRMPLEQRALALYNALSDRAWAYAEELDMDVLASEHGVTYYTWSGSRLASWTWRSPRYPR